MQGAAIPDSRPVSGCDHDDGRTIAPETRIRTQSGEVFGKTNADGCHIWLGIPYAEAPVGPLRWRAPRACRPWAGIRPAIDPGSASCQPHVFGTDPNAPGFLGGEDCLYLNVWKSSETPAGCLAPVMVWIHGGGNAIGHAASYNASVLARTQQVVVVSFNYRLGAFGWFSHPALRTPDTAPEERSGNFGMLDQIEALRWVRDNIAAFGGDPACVTIFGESDGGNNVLALLTCPPAAGLFHRAIVQSADLVTTSVTCAENFQEQGGDPRSSNEILMHLLLADELASDPQAALALIARLTDAQTASYLRSKSYPDFQAAYRLIQARSGGRHPPNKFEDGYLIPKEGMLAALQAGRYARVPIILGCTRDEFTGLILIAGGVPTFVEPEPAKFGFRIKDRDRLVTALDHLNAIFYENGVGEPAEALARYQPGEIFAYRFDWDRLLPTPWMGGFRFGATHGLDVPFVFGTLDLGPEFVHVPLFPDDASESFRNLSHCMMSYWAAFARSGTPNSGAADLPEWDAIDRRSGGALMIFGQSDADPALVSCLPPRRPALLDRLRTDARIGHGARRKQFLDDLGRLQYAFRKSDFDGSDA